jgi:hypothetical protein
LWLSQAARALAVSLALDTTERQHNADAEKRFVCNLPGKWKPKSPKDCPGCQSKIELAILKPNQDVIPYSQRKSIRGRSKRITTQGFAARILIVTTTVSPIKAYTQSSGMANAGLIDIFNTGNVI